MIKIPVVPISAWTGRAALATHNPYTRWGWRQGCEKDRPGTDWFAKRMVNQNSATSEMNCFKQMGQYILFGVHKPPLAQQLCGCKNVGVHLVLQACMWECVCVCVNKAQHHDVLYLIFRNTVQQMGPLVQAADATARDGCLCWISAEDEPGPVHVPCCTLCCH